MADWVELRVHGVSGTPPQDMLGRDDGPAEVVRVWPAGGTTTPTGRTAAYRRAERVPGDTDHVVEAFHWGDHTSGHRDQALWLLLLPFGMVNAAQFMLPPAGSRAARLLRALASGALRVLALVLTVLFVLAVTVIVLDLGAWQWLAPTGWLPDELISVVVAAAVASCSACVVLLSRLGRAGRSIRDVVTRQDLPVPDQRATEDPLATPGRLQDARPRGPSLPDFFAGDPDAPTLRRLHVAAGLLVVAHLGWAAVGQLGGDPPGWADDADRYTEWAIVGVTVLVALLGDAPGATLGALDARRSSWGWGAALLSWAALAAAFTTTAAVLIALVLTGAPAPLTGGGLVRVDVVLVQVSAVGLAALAALVVLVVGLGLATGRHADVPAAFGRFAHGWAAALVAGLGLFLGVGFTAAFTFFAQAVLDLLPGPLVRVTPLLERVALAWGVLGAVCSLIGLAVWMWSRRRLRSYAAAAQRAFRRGNGTLPDDRALDVGRAMAQARLKSLVQVVLLAVAAAGGVLAVALVVDQVRGPCIADPCGDAVGFFGQVTAIAARSGTLVTAATVIGVLLLLVLAAGLFLVGWRAFQGSGLRRSVNVVWDVIAYWPRAAHPLVPEPYSQDVVRDLRDRVEQLLVEEQAPRVVVAAHSLGSLVALSALYSLPDPLCDRVGVLTFGSQLRLLLPRAFPAHVTYRRVSWLAGRFADRWVSLYRETDYIGGPVASWARTDPEPPAPPTSCRLGEAERGDDVVRAPTSRRECGREWLLMDPPVSDPGARLRRHSDYWLDGSWDDAVRRALSGSGQPAAGQS